MRAAQGSRGIVIADAADKTTWLHDFRFNVQPENAPSRTQGYTTEKVPEALLAHAVPVTWGDPEDEKVSRA